MGLTRGVSPAMMAEISKPVWRPIILVWLDWPGGELRLHNQIGLLQWGGFDWSGVGQFGSAEVPGEQIGMAASSATLQMHGLPEDILEQADAPIRNRPGGIWLGAMTEAGQIAGDPISVFSGYMDALRFSVRREGEDVQHVIQVELGSGPSARQAAAFLHSAEDQATKYPGDTAGRHLQKIEARSASLQWPA